MLVGTFEARRIVAEAVNSAAAQIATASAAAMRVEAVPAPAIHTDDDVSWTEGSSSPNPVPWQVAIAELLAQSSSTPSSGGSSGGSRQPENID